MGLLPTVGSNVTFVLPVIIMWAGGNVTFSQKLGDALLGVTWSWEVVSWAFCQQWEVMSVF